MTLHVLYIEDDEKSFKYLEGELEKGNENKPEWSKVRLTWITHPSNLATALEEYQPDIVLADVYFQPEGTSPPEPETDHLAEILHEVRRWDQISPYGFPTPIIAYTGVGKAALEKCLEQRNVLYDIWDKTSAVPKYVIWRFQRLAAELTRHRPDATLQKLIAAMPSDQLPVWHTHILKMVKKYGEGHTEHGQIENCRDSLQSIFNEVSPKNSVTLIKMWDMMTESEPLLRAADTKIRGIARHSINVFWLGYWLINNPLLIDNMSQLWNEMIKSRADADSLNDVSPIEGLNTVWLIASLLHDVGKFHENHNSIIIKSSKIVKDFESLQMGNSSWSSGDVNAVPNAVKGILFRIKKSDDDKMVEELQTYISERSNSKKPDHGAIAAAYLVNISSSTDLNDHFRHYTLEAARAILLHSCIPEILSSKPRDKRDNYLRIEWQRDPIASLLLFCDQIQTWDRHNNYRDIKDRPDRAELSYLVVNKEAHDEKPLLNGCINYIAPSKVDMYPALRDDITTALNRVILEKPKDTLLHVLQENCWPFSVHLDCSLSVEKLSIDMKFK